MSITAIEGVEEADNFLLFSMEYPLPLVGFIGGRLRWLILLLRFLLRRKCILMMIFFCEIEDYSEEAKRGDHVQDVDPP